MTTPIHPVYPGHAAVLALQAMRAFGSAREALATTPHGCCALVGSAEVSGAGDSAQAAAKLIRKIWQGELNSITGFTWAQGDWVCRVGPGNHPEQQGEGLAQATDLRSAFVAACRDWNWSDPPRFHVHYRVTFNGYALDIEKTPTDDAILIVDEMTDGLRDVIVHAPGDRGTGASALEIGWDCHTRPEAERISNLAAHWFREKGWSILASKIQSLEAQ